MKLRIIKRGKDMFLLQERHSDSLEMGEPSFKRGWFGLCKYVKPEVVTRVCWWDYVTYMSRIHHSDGTETKSIKTMFMDSTQFMGDTYKLKVFKSRQEVINHVKKLYGQQGLDSIIKAEDQVV